VKDCRRCNYDLCNNCFNAPLKNCPGAHGLQSLVVPNDHFVCDGCECRLPRGIEVKHCSLCDYDLCSKCLFRV
jgi:hypothetical protein